MKRIGLIVLLTFGACSYAASSHEQSAVVGGKRIQPTPKSFEQRLRQHNEMQKKPKPARVPVIPSTASDRL